MGPSGRLVPSKHIGVHAATSHRMKPGLCWGLTQVGASAYTPRGRCRAAEGSALSRSPPGEAQSGREHNVCGCFGPNTAWLVQSSRGELSRPLPVGQSPVQAKGPAQSPAGLGASACTLFGWGGGAAEGSALALPTGRSPVRAGPPRVQALRPIHCSASAGQQGEIAPSQLSPPGEARARPDPYVCGWAKPSLYRRPPPCVGASACTRLGWC